MKINPMNEMAKKGFEESFNDFITELSKKKE